MKEKLKKQYEAACNAYLAELLKRWELDGCYGYWNSDQPGTIYHYAETHNLCMEDIVFIVENDITEEEVFEWEDYCLDAYEFHFATPNLRSWHIGCPRTPKEVFEKLRKMKQDLNEAINEEKERIKNQ